MQALVLPEGFVLPPLPYLFVILVASLVVAGSLYHNKPRITEQLVVSLAPWMAVGAGLYALEQVEAIPGAVAPFASSPTVYLTTFVVVGTIVLGVGDRHADRFARDSAPGVVLGVGLLLLAPVLATAVLTALETPPVHVFWPGMAVIGATAVSVVAWLLFGRYKPVLFDAGSAGLLVVFGHALDGLSTAVGLAFLGFGEQTPLSQLVIDVGGVWLFVAVKILLALFVVYFLAEYVREEPSEGNLLLAAVAAVGLGPGVHNVILFSIAG